MVGLPATADFNGYVSLDELYPILDSIKNAIHFGGVMIWDANYALKNLDAAGLNYYQAIHKYLTSASNSTITRAV